MHAGLIYRDLRNVLWRLHFASHRNLAHEPYSTPVACAIPDLDTADAMWLAKFFERIAANPQNQTIPYNLKNDESVHFDPNPGEIRFGVDSTGLGCATFVLAVFRSGGNRLVDTTGWPEANAADIAARTMYVNALLTASSSNTQGQGRKIQNEIRSPRVRPDHVAGACLEDKESRPAIFAVCEANSQIVVSALDADNSV